MSWCADKFRPEGHKDEDKHIHFEGDEELCTSLKNGIRCADEFKPESDEEEDAESDEDDESDFDEDEEEDDEEEEEELDSEEEGKDWDQLEKEAARWVTSIMPDNEKALQRSELCLQGTTGTALQEAGKGGCQVGILISLKSAYIKLRGIQAVLKARRRRTPPGRDPGTLLQLPPACFTGMLCVPGCRRNRHAAPLPCACDERKGVQGVLDSSLVPHE